MPEPIIRRRTRVTRQSGELPGGGSVVGYHIPEGSTSRVYIVQWDDGSRTFQELGTIKRIATPYGITQQEWGTILEQYDHRCAYCGKPLTPEELTVEHVVPISRGGAKTAENVVPSCRSCNSSKGFRTPEEWSRHNRGKQLPVDAGE